MDAFPPAAQQRLIELVFGRQPQAAATTAMPAPSVWHIAAARQGVLAACCKVITESDLTQAQRRSVMEALCRENLLIRAADLGIEET